MARKILNYLVAGGIIIALSLNSIMPARADGGIVIPDWVLWGMIEEGQQIAVIQLQEDDTAKIDLFITMVDRSGQSHEVTFFVPLGEQANAFQVKEENSQYFDLALTKNLDEKLVDYGRLQIEYQKNVRASLLWGTIATNGLWSGFVIVPLLLSSCSAPPTPVATYQTESSYISIYDMDEETDIQALIDVTGLDASVKATLEDLRGQQIAVVKLRTRPESKKSDEVTSWENRGQPGIHLAWETRLVGHSEEASYTYPLGTGRAWASPIELTRIYIVVPKEIDIEAQYPRLGEDLSGLAGRAWGGLAGRVYWKIDQAKSPAFAVDKAFGDYGQIWRITYIKSNSDRDLTIIRKAGISPETRSAIRRSQFQRFVTNFTWLIGLGIGIVAWLISWKLVMNRVIHSPWRGKELWGEAFKWCLIYPGFISAALFVIGTMGACVISVVVNLSDWLENFSPLYNQAVGIVVAILISLPALLAIAGVINAYLFARLQAQKLKISRQRAFGAYFLVILIANLIYLVFTQVYTMLVGTA